jgi:hypothetical protein
MKYLTVLAQCYLLENVEIEVVSLNVLRMNRYVKPTFVTNQIVFQASQDFEWFFKKKRCLYPAY